MVGNRDSRLVGWLRSGRAAHAGLVAAGVVAAAILAIGAVTVEDEPGTGADRGGQGIHMFNTIACSESVDVAALLEFKKSWIADPRSRVR